MKKKRRSIRRKKRIKKNMKRLFVVILLCFVVLLILNKTSFFDKIELNNKNDKKVIREPKEYKASVVMVGDALIHYGIYNDALQSDGSYNFNPMFEYIKPIVSKYDIAYYNQETILGGDDLGISSYPLFNTPQAFGDAMIDSGFNMVSLASNHTLDKRETGVLNSVNYWNSKNNVVKSGQWSSFEERKKSIKQVYEVNNIKYAYISYTTLTNGINPPNGKEYLTNIYSDEKAKEDIESVKDKVDFVIVAMHWGTEYSFGVNEDQDKIAKYLSDLGVDLIIGAHSHVVEPCEYINNNKTFVIYSLGNFISDQMDVDNQTGLMMEVTLRKYIDKNNKVTTSVIEPKAELIYTKDKKNFRVIPYPQLNDNILSGYQEYYEKYKGIVNTFYPDLTWGLTYK